MARLFFALQPDARGRQAIACSLPDDLAAARPLPESNLHVTLVFLGELDGDQETAVRAVADEIAASPFALCFSELAYWPRSRARVLVPEEVPPAAQALRAELARRLREAQLPFDARIWHPHLTVARRARRGGGELRAPITIAFNDFVLMRSRTEPAGAVYEPVGRWSLPGSSGVGGVG
ncbi:RNA 2',3'-cyclic phosphodiesterase [Aquisalimonas lutea]|uniref:RNA 2',3'-cyclic phosphodiesterase n=1 Tax=Aquisalimonas lutea TaxID=1327750 RepID=UPI0025B3D785|nr:RNA 2',3'-cyclic phosphodiesterase [Aquisalimonas lutea]MDN3517965.1 RNA 2',3'-cyclic phosphodiesterase [Aquisalimonas lutea]